MTYDIPKPVKYIYNKISENGFEAFLVGGCVRDLLLDKTPNDWDITTNAKPEDIINIFGTEDTFYENDFGTVGIKVPYNEIFVDNISSEHKQECLHFVERNEYSIVEVTPYRLEGKYSNARHPDEVLFSDKLEDDLQRRDFTVNALAMDITGNIIDFYGGVDDVKKGLIKAVGDPEERFSEDALRMLRAIRLSAQLNFATDADTAFAISQNAALLQKISKERIRDEFLKILMTDEPMMAIGMLEQLSLLQYIIPELRDGIGCKQGKKAHKYDVFEHLLRSLQHAADKNYNLKLRLAALFHDIGKPRSRRIKGEGYTFYGHEVVGAKMTAEIMKRLNMPRDLTESVVKLVRWHMFFSDPDEITLSAVRRMINNVGKDEIQNLLCLRICDRIGTGRPKEQPFRFRKYKAMVDEALKDPVSVTQLKLKGNDLKSLGIKPGPKMGYILHALLDEVLDNPDKNSIEYLRNRALELSKLSDSALYELGEKGKQKKNQKEQEEIMRIYKKYKVS